MVLQATNISKAFGKLAILKGVDLAVNPSEVVSIVGKSGAGKSTLLHILGTLDKADSGTLQINGQIISNLSPTSLAAFRNRNIGFVFQFHHLLPEFSALENVCLPGFIQGTDEKAVRKRATELLEYLQLGDRLDHKPTELSGGEQQRTAFARALVNSPNLVFADEPTGNLDGGAAKDMHSLILQLRKDFGTTFVIVTHNEELAGLSDRKLIMHQGRLE